MSRKFKDKIMQDIYQSMMDMPESDIREMLERGGSQQTAFADGYEGFPQSGVRDYRGTVVYAAYCAGVDRKKNEQAV